MTPATFPQCTAVGLAGCLATGVAHQVYATARLHQGHRGFDRRQLKCATGNLLSYHVRPGSPDGPTLVCEAGLMSTSVFWLLVADHIDLDTTVVLYDRAGYRRSLRRCHEPYTLQESVSDLAELVRKVVSPTSPCMLAGHSLGGYLVHRAADVLSDRVQRIVLVDPTHPRELLRSRAQREGSRGVDFTMSLGSWSALFGAGLLVDKKGLLAFADGSPYRRQLRLETSAVSTWQAARREWDYSYPFMLDGGRPLDDLRVPVTVVAAGSTLDASPEQRDLYEEYVASGTGGRVVVVDGATHLSIVAGMDHAPRTAQAIQLSEVGPGAESGVVALDSVRDALDSTGAESDSATANLEPAASSEAAEPRSKETV
ncbi:MAG: alpha/beta fold hydrolase [Dermatophilaceae bacterium]